MADKHVQKPLSIKQIMQHLPHRPPILMIDRVLQYGEGTAVAIKNVCINEPYFVGHFPGEPILPGVLIGESMAQTAAFIGGIGGIGEGGKDGPGLGNKVFLTSMHLKLAAQVVPGDQMVITARLIKQLGKLTKIAAEAKVNALIVASAELTVATL
jgi:3-hydroxyacyl-[acyl-carrier-protein] dehydratase